MGSMSSSRGPERPSAAPQASIAAARASHGADPSGDVAQEDFLFHLYRGSELLQENRVLEAKEELEFALTMQPLDPKGQDLLGAVYFRVGLYPRAIQIYEGLSAQFPHDVSIKINLALSYLKTAQPELARGALDEAVRLNPEHKRAWGYLGLALQKLGQLDQAQAAFERGGHDLMAKRLTERRHPSRAPSEAPGPVDEGGTRLLPATAFSELDAGELRLALAEPEPSRSGDGHRQLSALADAGAKSRSPFATTLPPASLREQAPVHQALTWARAEPAIPPLLVASPDRPLTVHPTGVLLVRIDEGQAFAARLDALRVIAGTASTRVLHRRARDTESSEVLGGIGSPLVRIAGGAQLVLGSKPPRAPVILALDDDVAVVREDMLLGFELRLAYESGRLVLDTEASGARGPSDGVSLVQLRGKGGLVLEFAGKLVAVPCAPGKPMLVRREWFVGWLGRLQPRALAAAESPNGQRGLISFSGEGTVLLYAQSA